MNNVFCIFTIFGTVCRGIVIIFRKCNVPGVEKLNDEGKKSDKSATETVSVG
jgi:hypothetical protein